MNAWIDACGLPLEIWNIGLGEAQVTDILYETLMKDMRHVS